MDEWMDDGWMDDEKFHVAAFRFLRKVGKSQISEALLVEKSNSE